MEPHTTVIADLERFVLTRMEFVDGEPALEAGQGVDPASTRSVNRLMRGCALRATQ